DASVHVYAAAVAGMALDRGAAIDHGELLAVGGHAYVVLRHDGDHGEHRARRLPALGAAAGVVVSDVALDGDGDGIRGAVAAERAALEFLVAGLDALVYRRM